MTHIEVLTYAKKGVIFDIRSLCACIADGAASDERIGRLERLIADYRKTVAAIEAARQEEEDHEQAKR